MIVLALLIVGGFVFSGESPVCHTGLIDAEACGRTWVAPVRSEPADWRQELLRRGWL